MSLPPFFAWFDFKREKFLYEENKDVVQETNTNNFHYLMATVMAVMIVLSFVGIFLRYGIPYVCYYVLNSFITLSLFLAFRHRSLEKQRSPLWLMYVSIALFYILGIFMSIYSPRGNQHESVTFPCLLIISPMLFIDSSIRINLFSTLFYVVHFVLAFIFKPQHMAVMDALDTTAFLIFGILLGGYFRFVRLESFEKDMILIKQRDTDFLTGLPNRRALFHELEELQKNPGTILNILMLDIDFFKQYNDSYGHQAGDACLASLGAVLTEFGKKHGLLFCRYGGEEFTAVGTGRLPDAFGMLAEELRMEVQKLAIPFEKGVDGFVSISAGYTTTAITPNVPAEKSIKLADDALYDAKNAGRNCVRGI